MLSDDVAWLVSVKAELGKVLTPLLKKNVLDYKKNQETL